MTTTAPARGSRDDELSSAVVAVLGRLQAQHLQQVAAAAARLARLRRALVSSPGSVPEAWADTVGALPPHLQGATDAPNDVERAMHASVCLYALHQQSQGAPMHTTGREHGLGSAVRMLRQRRARPGSTDADDDPVLRRFHALATATTFSESLQHLRGLVTLLRGEAIPLDYGRLAADLRRLQDAGRSPQVRLGWGRDLYRKTEKSLTPTAGTAVGPADDDDPGADA